MTLGSLLPRRKAKIQVLNLGNIKPKKIKGVLKRRVGSRNEAWKRRLSLESVQETGFGENLTAIGKAQKELLPKKASRGVGWSSAGMERGYSSTGQNHNLFIKATPSRLGRKGTPAVQHEDMQ